jgi:hypothetical protein
MKEDKVGEKVETILNLMDGESMSNVFGTKECETMWNESYMSTDQKQ